MTPSAEPGVVRVSRWALVAFLLGIVLPVAWHVGLQASGFEVRWLPGRLLWMTLVFAVLPLGAGVIALREIARGRGHVFGTTFAVLALVLSALFGLALLAEFPAIASARSAAETARCMSNLRRLHQAVVIYAAEHDGVFPDPDRWCDQLMPYVGDRRAFLCLSAPAGSDSAFAFNSELRGMQLDSLAGPERTILIFESDQGWNAAGGPELLPFVARHDGSDAFVFADGHMRRVPRRGLISGELWEIGGFAER